MAICRLEPLHGAPWTQDHPDDRLARTIWLVELRGQAPGGGVLIEEYHRRTFGWHHAEGLLGEPPSVMVYREQPEGA